MQIGGTSQTEQNGKIVARIKKGSQHKTKPPIMRPKVRAELRVLLRCLNLRSDDPFRLEDLGDIWGDCESEGREYLDLPLCSDKIVVEFIEGCIARALALVRALLRAIRNILK